MSCHALVVSRAIILPAAPDVELTGVLCTSAHAQNNIGLRRTNVQIEEASYSQPVSVKEQCQADTIHTVSCPIVKFVLSAFRNKTCI